MSKGIKITLAAFVISLFCGASFAMAQTATAPDAATVLPANVPLIYQLNTEVSNPLWPLFDFALQNFIQAASTSDSQETQKATDLFKSITAKNIYTFGTNPGDPQQTIDDPAIYITFKVSDTDYTSLLALSKDTIKKDTYKNIDIYLSANMYFANLKGLLVMTNGVENLKKCIDNLDTPANSLSASPGYVDALKHADKNSFFNMYIQAGAMLNSQQFQETMTAMSEIFNMDMLKMINMEYVSVSQNELWFELKAYVSGNQAELQKNDMLFSKYNFVPSLYKLITGNGLIFYDESNKLDSRIHDFLKFLKLPADAWTGFNDFKTQFKTDSGIDLDADVLPLINNGNATFVHKTSQLFPALTMVFETKNPTKAADVLAKFSSYLRKELDKEESLNKTDIYSYTVATINNIQFYTFIFNLGNLDSSFVGLPGGSSTLKLSMGVTSSGELIFTTHPDPAQILSSTANGILDNGSVNAFFTNPSETVTGVSYISVDQLAGWLNNLMTQLKAPAETIANVGTFFAPWHDMFSKSSATDTTAYGTIIMSVDSAKFSTYPALFEKVGNEIASQLEQVQQLPIYPTKDFTDVPAGEWYQDHLDALVTRGVLSGYEDGSFRPDAPITRAEFTTLLMKATAKAAAINSNMKPFTDVPAYPGEWYSEYVIMADSMGIINGYPDNTFRPNAYITRAEAIKIIYNISNQLKGIQVVDQPIDSLIHFTDVSKNDWFMVPVAAGVRYNIINGVTPTTFEPNRNLTRAEAAKIIHIFLENEYPNTWGITKLY